MKERKLYYRRKDKSIIIEGKQDGKSILIWTLPEPRKLIDGISGKASLFTKEKIDKINEKINRLDIRDVKEPKSSGEVPIINITRTPEIDEE